MAVRANPQGSEKFDIVVAAATRVFLTHGYSAATTDMIQQVSGVSKATIYSFFATKEQIFAAVMEKQCALFAERLSAIFEPQTTLQQQLTAFGERYLDILLSGDYLDFFRVICGEAQRFPHLAEAFFQQGPGLVSTLLAEKLKTASEAGDIAVSPMGVNAMAHQFLSLMRAECHMQFLFHPKAAPTRAQIEEWTRNAVTTFLLSHRV